MTALVHLCRCVVLLGAVCALSGCATVMNGTKQKVPIDSEPQGAEIRINGVMLGETPKEFDLSRETSHLVELHLDGYKYYDITLEPKMNAAVWGNVAAGGAVGMIVDGLNGSTNSLVPPEVMAVLERR